MKILVYTAVGECPRGYSAIARFLLPGSQIHPIVIHADTPERAEKAAQEWWDAEIAKERAKVQKSEERAAARRQVATGGLKVDPPADIEMDDEEGIG